MSTLTAHKTHPCHTCGAPHATHGIGHPARQDQHWFCADCFKRQPEGQAMFLKRIGEMADE
jgi:hypothetical protein